MVIMAPAKIIFTDYAAFYEGLILFNMYWKKSTRSNRDDLMRNKRFTGLLITMAIPTRSA